MAEFKAVSEASEATRDALAKIGIILATTTIVIVPPPDNPFRQCAALAFNR